MRAIDGAGFTRADKPGDHGPAPQLQWIEIARLRVDPSYQREITVTGYRNIRVIAENFDWRKFAPVIVAPIAGGFFAIVDGQHRTTGAFIAGEDSVPCCVIMADAKGQAEAFEAINGSVTKVLGVSLYKARLAAGDAHALRIKAACDAAGVEVLLYKASSVAMRPRQTLALAAIEGVMTAHGDAVVVASLRAIGASAGDLKGFFRGAIIRAVGDVLADHRNWARHEGLLAAFAGIDLDAACREAVAAAMARRGLKSGDLLQATIIAHCETAFGEKTPTRRSVAA
jgi:hypothetical protein